MLDEVETGLSRRGSQNNHARDMRRYLRLHAHTHTQTHCQYHSSGVELEVLSKRQIIPGVVERQRR